MKLISRIARRIVALALLVFFIVMPVARCGASRPSSPPAGLTAKIVFVNNSPTVQLSWQPVSRATSYRIYRGGDHIDSSSDTSYQDTNVSPKSTYNYNVAGRDSSGTGPKSDTVTITTPSAITIPGAPTGLSAAAGNAQIALSWNAVTEATSYKAKRSTVSGSGYATLASPPGTTYTNTGLTNGATYYFVVSAVNAAGESSNSAQAAASPRAPAPAVPTGLTATPGNAQAVLSWTASTGATGYNISRSTVSGTGFVTVAAKVAATNYTNTGLANGVTYYFVVSAINAAGTSANSVQAGAKPQAPPAPPPAPPAAPVGLTATARWVTSCPTCNGMPMAHILLTWQSAPGAVSYSLYRDGALLQAGIAAATYTDMAVVSGQSYSYTVAGVNGAGIGSQSAAASAIAPYPPQSSTLLGAPTNLCVAGIWQGGPADILAWYPVSGAASYNVYLYDTLIGTGLTGTSFTVPSNLVVRELTYTVTAVDSMGMETIPSSIASAQGAFDPASPPNWSPDPVAAPTALIATPEWNNGQPRIRLAWRGGGGDYTYTVFRDGQKAASGLWGLAYFDNNVAAGDTHSYTVMGSNVPFQTPVDSAQSAGVTATALSASPAALGSPVQVTGIVPNDDSVYVTFAAVPGAADYRIYNTAKPGTVKYSGGGLGIEMNAIDPAAGADLVIEAVDKMGPFQKMDGAMGPGTMQMDGSTTVAINGQGDPSNVPIVLASSGPFHAATQTVGLAGSQVFFDNFRGAAPLTQMASMDPAIVAVNGNDPNNASNRYVREFQNDKWVIRDYWGDMDNTKLFFMSNHFMDTLFDGGTPHSNIPIHNNNASIVMSPKATADISGGKVLHVTFEVDSHFDGRRWCDVYVAAAGDPLINPGKFAESSLMPTVSGNMFRWEIKNSAHKAQVFLAGAGTDVMQIVDWPDQQSCARISGDGVTPFSNGTMPSLDKRHKFDLYLSQTHFRLLETSPDGTFNVVRDKDLPAGAQLPFTNAQVYFVHQLYHTDNDRRELINWNPAETYWINYRPWSDERHWDNMGIEVLAAFP